MEAVTRNKGAAGIDRMTTGELENHLQAHWEKIRAKRYRIGLFSNCYCRR